MTVDAIPRITRQSWSDTHGPGTPESLEMASMSTWLPAYTEHENENDTNTTVSVSSVPLSPSTASSSVASLPTYDDVVGPLPLGDNADNVFAPTAAFHIHAPGRPVLGLACPSPADSIPIFHADAGSLSNTGVDTSAVPAYVSLRRSRLSNSCWLVRGSDDGGNSAQTPLCSTLYRVGPRRPPHIRILGEGGVMVDPHADSDSESASASHSKGSDPLDWETPYRHDMEVRRVGIMTRAQVVRSPYGLFRWRYASRKERAAHPASPDSLLVLEKLTVIAHSWSPDSPSSSSSNIFSKIKDKGKRRGKERGRISSRSEVLAARVAELVRSDETRTAGTKRCTAGNGGLVRMDLREWVGVDVDADVDEKRQVRGPEQGGAAAMSAEEEVRVFVLAGAMMMLKKETDRRRAQQAGVMGAVLG